MSNKESKKTPKPFSRKRGKKKTLPDFGVLEFYYYHLLLRMEEFDEMVSKQGMQIDNFDYKNIVSVLFTIIPDNDIEVENSHIYRFSQEEPTTIDIFIETKKNFPDITLKLIQVLLDVYNQNDQLMYHLLESDLSKTENKDTRIADDVRPVFEKWKSPHLSLNIDTISRKSPPSDDKVTNKRQELDKIRKDWLRLKEKYCGKFYPPHLSD